MTGPAGHALTVGLAVPQLGASEWCQPAAGGMPAGLRAYVTRAEQVGFASLWVAEPLRVRALDGLMLLSFAAAVTTTARLGSAVVLSTLRPPVVLARELASIDRVSGGRLDVGVALGEASPLDRAHGVDAARRVERFESGIALLERLWSEPVVSDRTPWWELEDYSCGLPPLQQPRPPLWFGARSDGALRRAAARGDGWIASGAAAGEEFSSAVGVLRRHLEDLDRDPAAFRVAKRVYVVVSEQPERARQRLRAYFEACYADGARADLAAVAGPAPHCASRLRALADAGADTLILHTVADHDEQLERLATDVLPLLDQRTAGRASP